MALPTTPANSEEGSVLLITKLSSGTGFWGADKLEFMGRINRAVSPRTNLHGSLFALAALRKDASWLRVQGNTRCSLRF